MALTQVSSARKFAVVAFSGVMALSLMLPTQMAHADYYFGDDDSNPYAAGEDASGEGWSYTAEGQQMNLVNYVGESITAKNQDLNIQLEGDNIVNGSIEVNGGDLTITGDNNVDGADKPSLDVAGVTSSSILSDDTLGGIRATKPYDAETGTFGDGKGNITISDANMKFSADNSWLIASSNLTIKDSRITKKDILSVSTGDSDDGNNETLLQGSEIEASGIGVQGTLTIDNTNLVVAPDTIDQKRIDDGSYEEIFGYKWIENAVTATKGINLKGEANGKAVKYTDEDGYSWYYLYTGEDYKVDLKASTTPAYWNKNKAAKGMPATSDTTMPMAMGLSIVAACAAAFAVYSARNRKAEGKHVK